MEDKQRILYVGYTHTKGFIKSKGVPAKYTDDFSKARIFSRKSDVTSASRYSEEDLIPVPVELTLDPQNVFMSILGFDDKD